MNRSLLVNGAVLGASLIAAYLVWTREPSPADENTIDILSFRKVDRVVFDSPEKNIRVERKADDQGKYAWVSVETKAQARPTPPPRPKVVRPPSPPRGRQTVPPAKAPAGASASKSTGTTPPSAAKPGISKGQLPKPRRPKPLIRRRPHPSPEPASLGQNPKVDPRPASPTPNEPPKTAAGRVAPRVPTSTALPAAPAGALPGVPQGKPGAVKTAKRVKAFVGKKDADQLLELMARLPAVRALGKLSKEKLEEFELSSSKTTLTVVSGSTQRRFRIGSRSHGNLDYYVQDEADQRVYLVSQKTIEQVKHAEFRLFNPNLHDFTLKDVDRVVISAQDRRKVLVQHDRNQPAPYWTDEGSSDKKDSYRNWLLQLERLRVVKYTPAHEPPQGVEEVVLVEFFDGGTRQGFLRVLEKATLAPNATNAAPNGASDFYLVSEYTRIPVEAFKARVQQAVKGLDDLFKD